MKVWKRNGIQQYRYTVECKPEECEKCRKGTPHRKHTKRIQRSAGKRAKGEVESLAFQEREEKKARAKGVYIPTVNEARRDWLMVNASEVGPGHWRNVNDWDPHGIGDFKVDKLTTEVVELARTKHRDGKGRISDKRADETVDGWMRILNLLVNFCIHRRVILSKPYDIKIPKRDKRPRPILPLDKVKPWLDAVDAHARNPQVGTVARLFIGLGLRESEANGARWEFVDWEAHTYLPGRIVNGEFVVKGKAKPKEIPEWLYAYLLELRGPEPRLGLVVPWRQTDESGNEIEVPHPSTFSRASIRAANKTVGTPGVTAHRVRGTWITQHARVNKLPPKELKELAGHASLSTTMGYYEDSSEVRRKAQENLAKEMGLA